MLNSIETDTDVVHKCYAGAVKINWIFAVALTLALVWCDTIARCLKMKFSNVHCQS